MTDVRTVETPARPAVEPQRDISTAWLVLAVIISLWILVFGRLVWMRHERFGSYGFDLAIFDQAIWLLSRFDTQFITIRGLPVFGHHGSFAFYLLTPFYWLGAGPHFLNILQVVFMAAGAVPVFLLAKWRLANEWMAVALATAYLVHPSLQFMAWELFHPEVMAIPFLLFAYLFAMKKQWVGFAVCCVIAVAWKEDLALAVFALGLVVLIRGDRRIGLITMGATVAWFLFVTRILLPEVSGTKAFYLAFFADLGDTPGEIVGNAIRHPSRVLDRFTAPDAKTYLWKMTAPFGFVPLLAPDVLLIGAPQTSVNLLSGNGFTRDFIYHYSAIPLATLTLATVEGIAFFTRRRPVAFRGALVGFVAASALASTLAWGLSPIGSQYRKGWWPLVPDARADAKKAALATVPDGAAVSATYNLDSHLTHRKKIYEFPNPFRPHNWGVANERYPSPNEARWLALDLQIVQGEDRKLYDDIMRSGQYEIRFQRDDVVVAERVRDAPG